ncbi:sugar kinase [Microbacteriaceae bacterium 4G12]
MSGHLLTLGETMGLFTATTSGASSPYFRLGIGGAETNVAIGVTRLGGSAAWVGRVGADLVGDLVLRELRAEGVETHSVTDPNAATGVMVKYRPIDPITRVNYHRASSAGSRLRPADIDPQLVETASIVHVTGITPALSDTAASAIDHIIDLAVDYNVLVSFDINHRPSLWTDRSPSTVYRTIIDRADIVFAGVDEARLLTEGDSPSALAQNLAALGPTQVLIKLGADGCAARIHGEELLVPALNITPVDTVGAGDAFAAGYLADLMQGVAPRPRLVTATQAGAFACLGAGDWESFPHREELALLDGGDPVIR